MQLEARSSRFTFRGVNAFPQTTRSLIAAWQMQPSAQPTKHFPRLQPNHVGKDEALG